MQLAPRYGDRPIVTFDLASDVRSPFLRQRDRLAATFAGLTHEEWLQPSRCDGWRVVDVASHLATTNRFWHASIAGGLAGAPTQILGGGFDPKATPAALVDAGRAASVEDTVAELRASDRALVDLVSALDDHGWSATAEAPSGHLPVGLVVHHALWDAWVHERDVLLPLGRDATIEADEVLACLRYAAALGPALLLGLGRPPAGSFAIEVHSPDARLVVEVGDDVRVHDGPAPDDAVIIRGDAVDVVEVLSIRTPPRGDVSESAAWLARSLAEIFEEA